MTEDLTRLFCLEYQNDPGLPVPGQETCRCEYSGEKVAKYVFRQRDPGRIPPAVMAGEEAVGEILIRNVVPRQSAQLGIVLKNARYKDRGIGTQAGRLAVR